MKLLLVRNLKDNYTLLSPDTYGMETWGSSSQTSLEKKRKYWYICSWSAGNDFDFVDEYISKSKINVVFETTDIDEVINYLTEHKLKCKNEMICEFDKIVNTYISFLKSICQLEG